MAIGNFLQLSFSSGMPRTDMYGVTPDRQRTTFPAVFPGKKTNECRYAIPRIYQDDKIVFNFHF